jgi:hypothetical protein
VLTARGTVSAITAQDGSAPVKHCHGMLRACISGVGSFIVAD